MDMEIYIFVAVTGFVAAFIDAAAGGGGMISLPALMLTGISPLQALGTNKMAAVMGACTSFITFANVVEESGASVFAKLPLHLEL